MGVQDQLSLWDDQWNQMSAHVIGGERPRGALARDNRMFSEVVLWIV